MLEDFSELRIGNKSVASSVQQQEDQSHLHDDHPAEVTACKVTHYKFDSDDALSNHPGEVEVLEYQELGFEPLLRMIESEIGRDEAHKRHHEEHHYLDKDHHRESLQHHEKHHGYGEDRRRESHNHHDESDDEQFTFDNVEYVHEKEDKSHHRHDSITPVKEIEYEVKHHPQHRGSSHEQRITTTTTTTNKFYDPYAIPVQTHGRDDVSDELIKHVVEPMIREIMRGTDNTDNTDHFYDYIPNSASHTHQVKTGVHANDHKDNYSYYSRSVYDKGQHHHRDSPLLIDTPHRRGTNAEVEIRTEMHSSGHSTLVRNSQRPNIDIPTNTGAVKQLLQKLEKGQYNDEVHEKPHKEINIFESLDDNANYEAVVIPPVPLKETHYHQFHELRYRQPRDLSKSAANLRQHHEHGEVHRHDPEACPECRAEDHLEHIAKKTQAKDTHDIMSHEEADHGEYKRHQHQEGRHRHEYRDDHHRRENREEQVYEHHDDRHRHEHHGDRRHELHDDRHRHEHHADRRHGSHDDRHRHDHHGDRHHELHDGRHRHEHRDDVLLHTYDDRHQHHHHDDHTQHRHHDHDQNIHHQTVSQHKQSDYIYEPSEYSVESVDVNQLTVSELTNVFGGAAKLRKPDHIEEHKTHKRTSSIHRFDDVVHTVDVGGGLVDTRSEAVARHSYQPQIKTATTVPSAHKASPVHHYTPSPVQHFTAPATLPTVTPAAAPVTVARIPRQRSSDQFNSIRVVRNVRDFVNVYGRKDFDSKQNEVTTSPLSPKSPVLPTAQEHKMTSSVQALPRTNVAAAHHQVQQTQKQTVAKTDVHGHPKVDAVVQQHAVTHVSTTRVPTAPAHVPVPAKREMLISTQSHISPMQLPYYHHEAVVPCCCCSHLMHVQQSQQHHHSPAMVHGSHYVVPMLQYNNVDIHNEAHQHSIEHDMHHQHVGMGHHLHQHDDHTSHTDPDQPFVLVPVSERRAAYEQKSAEAIYSNIHTGPKPMVDILND